MLKKILVMCKQPIQRYTYYAMQKVCAIGRTEEYINKKALIHKRIRAF